MIILAALLFTTQVAAIITNSSSTNEGYCDKELVNITLIPECDFSRIDVSIHVNKTNFSNFILQCENNLHDCYGDSNTSVDYVLTNQTLDVSFPFHHRQHAGKFINFHTTCQNQTCIMEHALLTPCLSGFTGNATVVGSKVHLYCEHSSFIESTSGIRITHEGNTLVHCNNKHTCYPGAGLPNGAYRKVEYREGMEFLCKMDGAVINLKIIVVAPTSTTTTFSTTTIITHDTSTSTSQSSTSMSTSFVKEGNSARHTTIGSLVTLSILFVHLFLLISP